MNTNIETTNGQNSTMVSCAGMLPASPPAVRVHGVSLAYNKATVLEDVSLTFQSGAITALVGPSGCGKTSFLTCVNRLTDMVPSSSVTGSVRVGDMEVHDPGVDITALRRRVGMLFQKPNPFPLSVRKNLELPLREHGMRNRAQIAGAIESALEDVGLWEEVKDRMDKPALALSGGQQQRLCLARACVLQPGVLLLDEPCSALDPMASEVVENLIFRLRGQCTVVVVTHNLAQARRIADEVAIFWAQESAGKVIEFGPARQIFEDPKHPLTAAYVSGRRG